MQGETANGRTVFGVSGPDRVKFLQGLVTNDVNRLNEGMLYAAILTPQGKYIADFFLVEADNTILIDCDAEQADDLKKRLSLYKLRADVQIETTDLNVIRGIENPPPGAMPDPRHPALGWRLITSETGNPPSIDWDAIRVRNLIPASGVELVPNDTFILEAGFERLGGVDFRKGCYVGQEVTARMKHKTELRKGLARVSVEGSAPVGSEIDASGKSAGTLYTQSGNQAIAYLRFDRAGSDMSAGSARIGYPVD